MTSHPAPHRSRARSNWLPIVGVALAGIVLLSSPSFAASKGIGRARGHATSSTTTTAPAAPALETTTTVPTTIAPTTVTTAAPTTTTLAPTTTTLPVGTLSVPATIDPTGATDVTAALNAFIAAAPDGSTLVFPAGGRYRIDGTVVVADRNRVTIEGNGSTFFAATPGDRTRVHWQVVRGSDVVLREIFVVGANPNAGLGDLAYQTAYEAQHGFSIHGTDGVELDRVRATDVYGDFVYLGIDNRGRWSSRVWIHDSTFARNGRQGIGLTAVRDSVIERNTMSEVRRTTLDFEPNGRTWGVDNVKILDNVFGSGRLMFVSANGVAPVSNIEISRNRLVGGQTLRIGMNAPEGTRRSGLVIRDNVSESMYSNRDSAPINVYLWDDVVVTGNVQTLHEGRNMAGVSVVDSCRVTVSGNQFPNAVTEMRWSGAAC